MKEAMKLALEALKQERENYRLHGDEDGAPDYIHESIKDLEEALKQEKKEDFFKQLGNQSMMQLWQNYCDVKIERDELQEKLAKQEQRKRLTDEQIEEIVWNSARQHTLQGMAGRVSISIGRAIEATHGIKE